MRELRASLGPNISEGPAFEKAIDKIMANIEWIDEHADEVVNQLKIEKDTTFIAPKWGNG